MNRVTLKDILKSKIEHLYGIEFNTFIDSLFSQIYGSDYKCIKQKRDLGSDGIIETKKICLACYAPEKFNKREFEKKVDEDFKKYEKNYKKLEYIWRFIINQKLLGNIVTYIENKDTTADIWGIEELINFALNLPPSKRRVVLREVFSLPPEFIEFDFIEEVISEISENRNTSSDYIPRYNTPLDTIKKIEINFKGEDIKIVRKKFEYFYAEHISYLQKTLESFDNDFISHIKMMILEEYQILNENFSFKEKFKHLVNRFSSKYPNDYEYKNYVELILLYFFEQCLIGTSTEEKNDTP